MSHMSVMNVPLNLLLVFHSHTLPKYLCNSSYSHFIAENAQEIDAQTFDSSFKMIILGNSIAFI